MKLKVHDTVDIKLKNGFIIKGFDVSIIRNDINIIEMNSKELKSMIVLDPTDIQEVIERIDLANCPFCGKKVEINQRQDIISDLDCKFYISCCTRMEAPFIKELAAKWNERVNS